MRWFTFGPRHSGKPTNDTPGKGLAGRISKAWPLTFPAVFFEPSDIARNFPALKLAARASPSRRILRVLGVARCQEDSPGYSNVGIAMMRTRTLVLLGLLLMPSVALAEERATDAALGAVSGAVVLGPIGAVAGALVGFTAGPSISHSWGLHRSGHQGQSRRTANQTTNQTTNQDAHASADAQPATGSQTPRPQAAAAPPAPARPTSTAKASAALPPVQTLE